MLALAILGLAGTARAQPPEDAYLTFLKLWKSMRTVVVLEAREGKPLPLDEQRTRLRNDLLPVLEGDLEQDLRHWLDRVDAWLPQFLPGKLKTFAQVVKLEQARRLEGFRPPPPFETRWMREPEAKKLRNWLDLHWDPLMSEPERPITEAEELLVLLGFRLEPYGREAYGWPRHERLLWHVVRPAGQDAVERQLQNRTSRKNLLGLYRKVDLIVTLRMRQDQWIIEELRWLDRPPGMLSGREQPRRR